MKVKNMLSHLNTELNKASKNILSKFDDVFKELAK